MFISIPVLIIIVIIIVSVVSKADENESRLNDLEDDLREKGLYDSDDPDDFYDESY